MDTSNIMECPHCNRPFSYTESGTGYGLKERERLICPYDDCGKIAGELLTGGWWNTQKLSVDETIKFHNGKSSSPAKK